MRADVHMHSSFSHDSRDKAPEEMIRAAIGKRAGDGLFYGSF